MADVELGLERTRDMPRLAREFVTTHFGGLSAQARPPHDVCTDVVLLVSELVTNVVRHGEIPASLRLSVVADTVRVSVHDSGDGHPASPLPVDDPDRRHGRGLVLIDALSSAWGVHDTGPGKDVWFDISYLAS